MSGSSSDSESTHSSQCDSEYNYIPGYIIEDESNDTILQSLSEVVGTHVVLDCKWIITVIYTQYHSPLPSPHPNQCCFNQNSSNLTRNGTQH